MKNAQIRKAKKVGYYNIPFSFDIETTSFRNEKGEKRATMYAWTFGINGAVILGRTWEDFLQLCDDLTQSLELSSDKRIIVYVHNLSFEIGFIQNLFEWDKIFATDSHKPLYALTKGGIEFRCSYRLSGFSLAKLSDQLTKYHVEKLVGDLDYSLPRHCETPLTEKEVGYMVNDSLVVMAYIQERIEYDGSIAKIPLTKTGYVRRFCRNKMTRGENPSEDKYAYLDHRDLMKSLTLTAEDYKILKRAFCGGYTHANALRQGRVYRDVHSWDLTSSYPAVMCAYKFPMTRGEWVSISGIAELKKMLRSYCCVFDIRFIGLRAKKGIPDHYISRSKCFNVRGKVVVDNGRIDRADDITTTITDVDFQIIERAYDWDGIGVDKVLRFHRGYLPKKLILAILELFSDKTTLKGVEGKEQEYLVKKNMLNAVFGASVTDVLQPTVTFINGEWSVEMGNLEEAIEQYNESKNRFLYYPWGLYTTAYARAALWSFYLYLYDADGSGAPVHAMDYIYSDTDSIKVLHGERYAEYIEKYNSFISAKLEKMCAFYDIDVNKTRPIAPDGKQSRLGEWCDEGCYDAFKTLGAKRYAVKKGGNFSITVSGLNKKICVPWMLEAFGAEKFFDAFSDSLHVPANATGKNTHTYIDYPMDGILTDYKGKTAEYHEKSGVHLEAAEYSLDISEEYLQYIFDLQGVFEYEK